MKITPADSSDWNKQNGDATFRLNYDNLTPDSVVVDIGARHGNWADLIREKYKCNVFCFEAVNEFCEQLRAKRYEVFNCAVLDTEIPNHKLGVFEGEASILYDEVDTNEIFTVNTIRAAKIFELISKEKIDLMKINVEGAEYRILNNLIDTDCIQKIKNIQVQFHLINGHKMYYELICERLRKTHKLTWQFPFVWENWELIEPLKL